MSSFSGDASTIILLYNRERRSVILIRQFRFPTYGNGHDGFLIETAAGLLDQASPKERIKAEAEEETGYRVTEVRKIFEAFMSPGSVTEKLYFFIAEYDPSSHIGDGGGLHAEGENIQVPVTRSISFLLAGSGSRATPAWLRRNLLLAGIR